jgi:hypothetical protein
VPRWELVTGWILRVAILATAGIYIALGQLAAGLFCVLALALAMTPTIVARTATFTWPFEVELVLLWLLAAHLTLGRMLGLYNRVGWFDKVLHLGDSALIGFVAFLAVYVAHYMRHERPHPWVDRIAIVIATLGLGALWEIIEFAEDQLLGMHTQGSPQMSPLVDTMWDLILDGIGGVIAGVLGPWFMHHSKRSRRRVQEFARRVEA